MGLLDDYEEIQSGFGQTETLVEKKKLNKFDVILIIMGITLFLFIVTMIILFCLFQSIPDTLVISVFGIFTGECGIMGMLKHSNNKYSQYQYTDMPLSDIDETTENGGVL